MNLFSDSVVVAKVCWSCLADIFHIDLGIDFEYVARWWVSNNRHKVMNYCSAALMWCLSQSQWRFYEGFYDIKNNQFC